MMKIRKLFLKELLVELQKVKPNNIEREGILLFIENIFRYLDNNESEEYQSDQELLSIWEKIYTYITKVQNGLNFDVNKYHKLNKIVVMISMRSYY